MSSFQKYQQDFVQDLTYYISQNNFASVTGNNDNLQLLVNNLIDALPSYNNPAMINAHRQPLINLLEVNLPNEAIAIEPYNHGSGLFIRKHSYIGFSKTYKDAFFFNVSQSEIAVKVLQAIQNINLSLNSGWWGNYCVAVLTDAIRQKVSIILDTNKLTNNLASNNDGFMPGLSASYLTVFQNGYTPTANAFQAIQQTGQIQQAGNLLNEAIKNEQFKANINIAIAAGGDSAVATTWLLFNLWITLRSLEYPNVDGAIATYQNQGLSIPLEVGPEKWWNGTYRSWYKPLCGADLMNQASDIITAPMYVQEENFNAFNGIGNPLNSFSSKIITVNNGYSHSFCEWGKLNWFKPKGGSCFGKGTGVLMADGTSKNIEDVKIGDEVMTDRGKRKVVLVESPKKQERKLHTINGLQLFVTGAHPFRTSGEQASFAAISPWGLIDGIPSIMGKGVAKLEEKITLLAYKNGEITGQEVNEIQLVSDESNEEEPVYDLILENWAKNYPTYFVGGPDVYLATIGETVDPYFDVTTSAAIITILNMVVPISREHLSNPNIGIPRILSKLDIHKALELAEKGAHSYIAGKEFEEPTIPPIEFYLENEVWDEHASMLEYYLVKHFGRTIKAELRSFWKHVKRSNHKGKQLNLGLLDIEFINEPIRFTENCHLSINVAGKKKTTVFHFEKSFSDQWYYRIDDTLNLGKRPKRKKSFIHGELIVDGNKVGSFRTSFLKKEKVIPRREVFLFDNDGAVIGRVGMDLRKMTKKQIRIEQEQKTNWDEEHEFYHAISLGKQIGYELASKIEAFS